jgi:glutamate racemase
MSGICGIDDARGVSPEDARRPIGVFDSGIGGLTVAAALARRMPAESILYLGDTARLPYGSKSPATVTRYTRTNVEFLSERGVKAVVVACNTASALALPHLERKLPIWGVIEPGAARAAEVANRSVGVVATEATTLSNAYPDALARLRPELEIHARACPLFVPLVEEGWVDDEIADQVASRYLKELLAEGVDTLVLGCTHYPLLKPTLGRVAGPDVALVDSAETVAERVAHDLAEAGLAADPTDTTDARGSLRAFVTDATDRFAELAERILERPVPLELVDVTEPVRSPA